MSEQTPQYAPPPSSQTQNEEDKPSVAEQASKLVGSNTNLHPLEGDPVKDAEEFEKQKQADLDAERQKHMEERGEVTR